MLLKNLSLAKAKRYCAHTDHVSVSAVVCYGCVRRVEIQRQTPSEKHLIQGLWYYRLSIT